MSLAHNPPGSLHILACKRAPVPQVMRATGVNFPQKWIDHLEQNQKIDSCCRHPENHEIEAFYSKPEERDKGTPDIYKFHCTCGRCHVMFCVGSTVHPTNPEIRSPRPFWDIR